MESKLEAKGPDASLSYIVRKPFPSQDAIVTTLGDVVSASVAKREGAQPIILSFILGRKQARPWVEELATGLAVNDISTLHYNGEEVAALTLIALTKVPHLSDESQIAAADELRQMGNTAFKKASKFKEFKKALLMYNRALEVSQSLGDTDRIFSARSNITMCHMRMEQWGNVIAGCDALEKSSAKAYYRRTQAQLELDIIARSIRDIRKAAILAPNDKFVQSEVDRIEAEACRVFGKRRTQFAETYSIMVESPIFKQPFVE